eukprot:1566378-Rhodomonas_salina.3
MSLTVAKRRRRCGSQSLRMRGGDMVSGHEEAEDMACERDWSLTQRAAGLRCAVFACLSDMHRCNSDRAAATCFSFWAPRSNVPDMPCPISEPDAAVPSPRGGCSHVHSLHASLD